MSVPLTWCCETSVTASCTAIFAEKFQIFARIQDYRPIARRAAGRGVDVLAIENNCRILEKKKYLKTCCIHASLGVGRVAIIHLVQ